MFVEFSYPFDPEAILMPGSIDKPQIIPRSRMVPAPEGADEGVRWDSYNTTSFLKLFVHTGTHIDTPYHVAADGARLGAFAIEDFVFNHPVLLEIPKSDMEKITVEDLKPHEEQLSRADLLLVYTGFSKWRSQDPERYMMKQPGFSVGAAEYLMGFFSLRCVGADTMGIENIPEGRAANPPFPAHRVFLLTREKFLILEDPNLAPLVGKQMKRAYLIPLRLPDLEAMSVTAFADV